MNRRTRMLLLLLAVALVVIAISVAVQPRAKGTLPPPEPPETVTTVNGANIRPVNTAASERMFGANAAPDSQGGADAAPPTRTYTIYDASAEAEQDFTNWWHYESQIFTAQAKPLEEVYADGVLACSYRAMKYSADQVWRHFDVTKDYAGTDAAAVVAAAFRALCPTQVELSTTPNNITGFKTYFDSQVDSAYFHLKYSPNVTNLVGTPTLFDLGYFTKHVCHGMRLHGNTPAMLQYLIDNANGPHGSTYLPVLAAQKDGAVRYDGVLGELTRIASTAAGCMSVIGG